MEFVMKKLLLLLSLTLVATTQKIGAKTEKKQNKLKVKTAKNFTGNISGQIKGRIQVWHNQGFKHLASLFI